MSRLDYGPHRERARQKLAAARDQIARRARQPAQLDLADLGRREFVKALDAAAHDVEVSDWEASFLGTCLRFVEQDRPFTDKMRTQLDRMMDKYLGRVKWGDNEITGPVRSQTRQAYVPDERRELFQKRQ